MKNNADSHKKQRFWAPSFNAIILVEMGVKSDAATAISDD
jgi:hypothetical protein